MHLPFDGLRRRARFYFVIGEYRSLAWVAKHTPRSILFAVARVCGVVGPLLSKKQARLVARHIEKASGKPASKRQVQDAFASYVRYWFDAFRVTGIDKASADALVSTDGGEHIFDALAQGRGVILALPHTGNWDVAGAWMVMQDASLTVVAELLEPPEMFEWFKNFRMSLGMNVVGNGPRVSRELLTALADNHVVALLCDRDVDGTGGEFEFFGEVTRIPKGPATLAFRSGAPILPLAVFDDGRNYKLRVLPPLDLRRDGKLSEDVDRVTKELISKLEYFIRLAPEQWHVFQPNWPSEKK